MGSPKKSKKKDKTTDIKSPPFTAPPPPPPDKDDKTNAQKKQSKVKKHKEGKNEISKGDNSSSKASLPLLEVSRTGFKILPILMPLSVESVGLSATPTHYCYFKEHEAPAHKPSPGIPSDRTLFITNLPIDTTEYHIKHLFRECGSVERVIFHGVLKSNDGDPPEEEQPNSDTNASKKKRKRKKKLEVLAITKTGQEHLNVRQLLAPGSSGHVIFTKTEGLKKALSMIREERIWSAGEEKIPPLGVQKWLTEYKSLRRDPVEMQAEVDEYMRQYEALEQEKQRELEAKRNKPDEDGFILVTRAGRRNTNTDGSISVTAARPEEIKNLKPKNKELVDFYRFQTREVKRNKLIELRKKFEEDKQKIAKLKAERRFKPY